MSTNPFTTDWNNVDLDSPSNRALEILDGYSFQALLLEIYCNLPEINENTVTQQFETELRNRIDSARDVFQANLKNIVKTAKAERRG